MNKIILLIVFMLIGNHLIAQNLDVQTFGNETDKPIIFLHGGPGYNSVAFEKTTAKQLAENGFFVISYDRRGEGRNQQIKADYTFAQTIDDLKQIYETYGFKKATLIGHSFGGVVGTLFADDYPEKVKALILVGAPISMQETLQNIITKSKKIYQEKDDKVNLNYINMLENMDSTSLEYSSYSFMHAMSNGFYVTKTPNIEAKNLYQIFKSDSLLIAYASKMDYISPQMFWKNEQYTTMSLKENLERLKAKGLPIYGMYGKEDGLYSVEQVNQLKALLGDENVVYLDNCSHNVFIDRQKEFIELLVQWTE